MINRLRVLLSLLVLVAGFSGASHAAAQSVKRADVVGEWHGLKSVVGVDGRTILLKRSLVFKADGTYVSKEPDVQGRYELSGSTVTLPRLYILTYENGHMLDTQGVLTRGHFKAMR